MPTPNWDIRNEGRAWDTEAMDRYWLTPQKIPLVNGKLFHSNEARELMLGMLLENMGADCTVRLGDPKVWKAAVAKLG